MPAIGTVTINDGASTPVAHNFEVVTTTGSEQSWADRSGGIPSGYPTLKTRQKDPSNTARNYRMQLEIALPTVATDPITGKPYVARTNRFNCEFVLSESSVLQERKDILAFAKNALATAMMTAVVTSPEHVY